MGRRGSNIEGLNYLVKRTGLFKILVVVATDLREDVRLLCIPFLLEGAAVTANARLRRDLRFGALAIADVLGEMAFLVAALFLLWNRLPQWTLGVVSRRALRLTR